MDATLPEVLGDKLQIHDGPILKVIHKCMEDLIRMYNMLSNV